MSTIEILPFILFVVVIATAFSERLSIPYPLLLVIAGIIVGFVPGIPNWHPPSSIVLPLFLPPILFSAARTISWRDTRNNTGTIGFLSIGLVVVTAFLVAMVMHWVIPGMSISSGLVLGAIISPTDTIAATSILSKMNIQQSIIRTVEVESLFNDATGIVLYNMAILFVAMGTLHLSQLGWHSVGVGLGGVVIGLSFSFLTGLIVEQFLSDSQNNLPIVMSLILAYVAYLFAERVGASGVLAVVAAGLYHKRTERSIIPAIRLSEKTVWDTLIFFLNGIIFITIGIQFPSYLQRVSYLPISDLLLFSIMAILALIVLRLLWVIMTEYLVHCIRRIRHGDELFTGFSIRRSLVISWSGMRGLVSLALAVALPMYISDGVVFPYRDLIIFLTIIAILFTLLVQGLTLPWLIHWLGLNVDDEEELRKITAIYQQLTKKAIDNMRSIRDDDEHQKYSKESRELVENYYANRALQYSAHHEPHVAFERVEIAHEARELLAKILRYERELVTKLRAKEEISEEIYIKILHKFDRDEVGFASYQ